MRPTYSIRFRLQRTVKESATVSVPIGPELLKEDGHLDTERAMQIAVKLAEHESTHWEPEGEPIIAPHPTQLPAN
jgi:hypothetical protein